MSLNDDNLHQQKIIIPGELPGLNICPDGSNNNKRCLPFMEGSKLIVIFENDQKVEIPFRTGKYVCHRLPKGSPIIKQIYALGYNEIRRLEDGEPHIIVPWTHPKVFYCGGTLRVRFAAQRPCGNYGIYISYIDLL